MVEMHWEYQALMLVVNELTFEKEVERLFQFSTSKGYPEF